MIPPAWTTADVDLACQWAAIYRMRGYNVLPSDPTLGHPPYGYRQWWDSPASEWLMDRFPLPSIQVMCGRRWRLMVIDLDGPEAPHVWRSWGQCPRTWETESGGGGRHLWFSIPREGPPLPKGFLWQGEGKHSAIERLADLSLVMAPPSIHRKSGRRYRFASKRQSPIGMPMPAPAPSWALARPLMDVEPPAPNRQNLPIWRMPSRTPLKGRDEVLAMVPDKIGLARQWGVRFRGRRSQRGWHECHAIDREDRTPSAAVHEATGIYVDRGTGLRLSFFDLAITLGVYRDYREAVTHLGGNRA